MWIKILLLVALAILFVVGLRVPRGARHLALRRMVMFLFVVFAAASVIFPEIWNAMANAIGVGRGTDLLLYTLIVACLGYVASSYLRFRELEFKVTQLARRIALDEAGAPAVPPAAEERPAAPEPLNGSSRPQTSMVSELPEPEHQPPTR